MVITTPHAIKTDNKLLHIDYQNLPQIIHCLGFSLTETEKCETKKDEYSIIIDIYGHYR